jgi:hypothetical protein
VRVNGRRLIVGAVQRGGADRGAPARDQEASARALWRPVRAQGAAARPVQGTRGRRDRRRTGRRGSCAPQHSRAPRPRAPGRRAQAVPGAPAARTGGDRRALLLRGVWLGTDREARRGGPSCRHAFETDGEHRYSRDRSAPVEGDPDGTGEGLLSRLRADQSATGAVPSDAARLGRTEPARDGALREVWPASAAEPTGRTLCARGGGSEPLDLGRVGAAAAALAPLHARIAAHARRRATARRRHSVPVLAKGKTSTGRLWVCVRDDRPFAGGAPPAALYRFSRDCRGEHPQAHLAGWRGILQADACAGFGAGSTPPIVARARSHRRCAGALPAASSSSSPISPLLLDVESRRRRSRRPRSRR